MKTNFNLKAVIISMMLMTLVLGSAFVVAKNEKWYEKEKPSDKLNLVEQTKLITVKDQYVWNTSSYWKDGNCYYFDLKIGNSTNVTWTDPRRELTCTTKSLSIGEIDDLQAENIAWTLRELAKDEVVPVVVLTDNKKSEDLKKGTISDAGVTMDAIDNKIIAEELI